MLLASAYLAACNAVTPAPLNGRQTPGMSLNITSGIYSPVTVTASDQITWTNQNQRDTIFANIEIVLQIFTLLNWMSSKRIIRDGYQYHDAKTQ
jgi:hypothetical protein